jgi:tetratricopeptide (TPR) repeat protein
MLKEDTSPYLSGEDFADKVRAQLTDAKFDISQSADLHFYLSLPNREVAESCVGQVRESLGLEASAEEDASELGAWLCHARGTLVPESGRLAAIGNLMLDLARKHGGEFQGWDTEPEAMMTSMATAVGRLFGGIDHSPQSGDDPEAEGETSEEDPRIVRLNEGFQAIESADFATALAIGQDLIDTEPDAACHAWQLVGHAQSGLGDEEKACRAFGEAAALDPEGFENFSNWGASLDRLGRLDEAMEKYRAALDINPDYATAFFNMAYVHAQRDEREALLECLLRASSLRSDLAEAAFQDEKFMALVDDAGRRKMAELAGLEARPPAEKSTAPQAAGTESPPKPDDPSSRIFPSIVQAPPAQGPGESKLIRLLGHGLSIALGIEEGSQVRVLKEEDLAPLNLTPQDAQAHAIENLEALVLSGEAGFTFIPSGPGNLPFIVCAGHWASSSCLLLPRLWQLARAQLGADDLCASIPHRQALIVFAESDRPRRDAMRAMVRDQEAEAAAAGPLTWELFRVRENAVEPFVEGESEGGAASPPIPAPAELGPPPLPQSPPPLSQGPPPLPASR